MTNLTIWKSILLGIIQGLTEFLPISSSGHLAIAEKLFHLTPNLAFVVILHFSSFLAVLIYFNKKIILLTKDIFTLKKAGLSYLGYIMLGIIPAALAGLFFEDFIDQSFSSLKFVGVFLILTSFILYIGTRFSKENNKLSFKNSLIIGIFQIIALFPGVSRSGTTISTGLVLGLNREESISFSFIMALPLIAGAMLLKINDLLTLNLDFLTLSSGFIAAFITSIIAIDFIFQRIKSFKWFSIYTAIAGIILLTFS